MKQQKKRIIGIALVFLNLFFSPVHAHYHGHGGNWGYSGPGPHAYIGPGYYPGWGGPNVIINVPIIPIVPRTPYIRECEDVEVCNQYDECWLERHCY